MSKVTLLKSEVDALLPEFKAYVRELKWAWDKENRPGFQNVLEVMSTTELAQVEKCIKQWGVYIEPLANAWWKERGIGVIWPDDNSKPVQYYKLESA